MKFHSIILARGGSVGIPRKNIKEINGLPLIAHTIKQCQKGGISNIYTSSDDQEILEIASGYGSKVIQRPDNLSTANSTSEEGWIHALSEISTINYQEDWIFAPQITSPIRHAEDINQACKLAETMKFDSILSVVEFDDFFLWETKDSTIKPLNHDFRRRKRRQEIGTKTLLENGSFYIFRPGGLISYNNRLHGKIGYYKMEKYKMFQIDEPADVEIVEYYLKKYNIGN